ncbi:HET domain-containing protein [Nannizzia gypsea CBS 118893]|uniref:HET domain-containing protein n=1 Tax=Arthroderma gypseum (strain ATCC MYA-4604 / CBS 118893) TaxID=535722 RepID=E4V628_ARTGP|nr:HET domain-containing protein [Nannizzia gypsea CBS 118893]EFR05553.1 HET domain-containing protein [Nannizzia gypsea CBS 118893]
MTEKPLQSRWSLTKSDVRAILDDNTHRSTDLKLLPIEWKALDFGETGSAGSSVKLSASNTKARMIQWCQDAFALVRGEHATASGPNYISHSDDTESYFGRLDSFFSTLMTCNFLMNQKKLSYEEVLDRACALLSRLPAYPPELNLKCDSALIAEERWPAKHLTESNDNQYKWSNLSVFVKPSTNTIRVALYLTMKPVLRITNDYSDTIAQLLDILADLYKSAITIGDSQAWFVVQAYLWAAWQHTVMLQLWCDASTVLQLGYMFERHNSIIWREIPSVMPSREIIERSRPEYMCKWAFELLRSDLSAVTQDFRALFEAFERQFGGRPSRCNISTTSSSGRAGNRKRVCDGKAPGNCQRFESDDVQIQSAHDFACPNSTGETCTFLTWDEQSYRSIKGVARAVDLDQTDDKYLRYRPLSFENMAISHVWSHGQGGRPETGFNICLHRRYSGLARSLGCSSYWMDTPCIPTPDDLRDEAIGQINDNFMNSKVTLLVDRDLMQIDIHPLTLEAEEAILATLVVCDWNVRGWTLLEGMRGRMKLHILCKNNHVISLMDVLRDVTAKSTLSLISPALAIYHYTPTQYEVSGLDMIEPVTTEQATCLLNHRHVTKERDLIIIWSLVCASKKIAKKAEDFWASTVGQSLATGFLVSGTPRLTARGFSWAPERPNVLPSAATTSDQTKNEKQYPAFDGQSSLHGTITPQGFKAEWLTCRIRRSKLYQLTSEFTLQSYTGPEDLVYWRVYNVGANQRMNPESMHHLRSVIGVVLKKFRWVALLMPALRGRTSNDAVYPPRPFEYQGEAEGSMMVVVASNNGDKWEWQFVHEWDRKFLLPEFTCEELLIA